MINYNSKDLVVGLIKETLKSFNLPSCKVLVDNEPCYLIKGNTYIYGNKLLIYVGNSKEVSNFTFVESDFDFIQSYYYNKDILNITNNLIIKNNFYDINTHIRLGNYLRFLRDYKGVDLMTMYNCFNNQVANNVNIKGNKYKFNSLDPSYKLYVVPVKFFKTYTMALDCSTGVETILAFYKNGNLLNHLRGNDLVDILPDSLYDKSYMKIEPTRFNYPIKINPTKNLSFNELLAKKESELVMLVKVPSDNKSSFVVLETNNDFPTTYWTNLTNVNYKTKIFPTTMVNHSVKESVESFDRYYSKNQLMYINDGIQHPFSNRLVEYLSDNVVSPLDDITLNTKRVEDNLINQKVLNSYTQFYEWNNYLRAKIYLKSAESNLMNNNFDLLGYVDKDVEVSVIKDYDYDDTLEG